jgi:hypothetical protein
MIRKTSGIGIAIENNCAVEFIDGRFYKVISSKNYARAYTVYKSRGKVSQTNASAETARARRVAGLATAHRLTTNTRCMPFRGESLATRTE